MFTYFICTFGFVEPEFENEYHYFNFNYQSSVFDILSIEKNISIVYIQKRNPEIKRHICYTVWIQHTLVSSFARLWHSFSNVKIVRCRFAFCVVVVFFEWKLWIEKCHDFESFRTYTHTQHTTHTILHTTIKTEGWVFMRHKLYR